MRRVQELAALQETMRHCTQCIDAGFSVTRGSVFSGGPGARLLLVGQAPGAVEAATRQPFSGPSGRRLFAWLAQAGWDEETFRREAYITAVTRCYPGKSRSGRGDRVPATRERALCAPYLEREVFLLRPKVVIAVGRAAIAYFLGGMSLSECIGGAFPAGRTIIVPLPHPSGANLWLNAPRNAARLECALSLLASFRRKHGL